MTVIALVAVVLAGVVVVAVGAVMVGRAKKREKALLEILELPYGERDVDVAAVAEAHPRVVEAAVGLADKVVGQVDEEGGLAMTLERATIPLRPGEYVLVTACAAVILAVVFALVMGQWLFAVLGPVVAFLGAAAYPKRKIAARRRAFEEQLPDALSLIASSLSAGHTFLRAIQMMVDEAEPPLSEEFGRALAETRLGGSVVDALDHMAKRLELRDMQWVVQAIRIQQTVGGKLADLLHTLAGFIRAREEVRREVKVLTAEGRMSAGVLAALPLFLLIAIQVIDPGYIRPMLHGWGLVALGVMAAMVAMGTAVIVRMVKIEV